jgi:hypothetical protein
MGAARPFREAGEMWCEKDSTTPQESSRERHEGDAGDDERRTARPGRVDALAAPSATAKRMLVSRAPGARAYAANESTPATTAGRA